MTNTIDWKEYTPTTDGQAPDDWDGGKVEIWLGGSIGGWMMCDPPWYNNHIYRYRPKAFDWSQFNAVRDAKGKIVPAEFVGEDGEFGRFRILGNHSSTNYDWPCGEKWFFEKDETRSAGITLIHHDFDAKPQPSPELVERMVEVVTEGTSGRVDGDKCRAILAELEPVQPVDPDLELAREIFAERHNAGKYDIIMSDGVMAKYGAASKAIMAGEFDTHGQLLQIKAVIKRVRTERG